MRRRLGVISMVLLVVGGLSACGQSAGPDGVARVSLNPMAVAREYGLEPQGDEVVVLEDGWEDRIPDTNEGMPAGYPRVEHKAATVEDVQDLQAAHLEQALAEVQEETGVGPWQVVDLGVLECGPAVTGHDDGARQIGASPILTVMTESHPTDDQFFEVIEVFGRFYPGVTEAKNQWRGPDEVGARGYSLLSEDDDLLTVAYNEENPGMVVRIDGGCYITADTVAYALDQDFYY